MGGIFQTIETTQPSLEGKTTEQKIDTIMNYLFMLREQLDYALCNLDAGNFNETGLSEITSPIYKRIEDDEENIAQLEVTAQGLSARMTNAEGDISSLELTASGLSTRMTNAEGDISSLQQTATSLTTRITSAEGDISTLEQTATSLTTRVGNAEGSISTLQQTTSGIMAQVTDGQGNYTVLNLKSDGLHIGDASGTVTIAGSSVQAGSLVLTDNLTFTNVQSTANGAASSASSAYSLADAIRSGTVTGTFIDHRKIYAPEIYASVFNVMPEKDSSGYYSPTGSYNIYGAFGRYVSDPSLLYHFLSIAYSGTDLSPHITFSSPNGADVRWRFVKTTVEGPVDIEDEVSFGDTITISTASYGTVLPSGNTGDVFFLLAS